MSHNREPEGHVPKAPGDNDQRYTGHALWAFVWNLYGRSRRDFDRKTQKPKGDEVEKTIKPTLFTSRNLI